MMSTSDNQSVIISRLQLLLTILGVLAPAGYLIGLSFYQGWLSAYGVYADSFPKSIQETYYIAYLAVSYLCIEIIDFSRQILMWLSQYFHLASVVVSFVVVTIVIYFLIKLSKQNSSGLAQKFTSNLLRILSYLHWKNNDFTRALGITSLAVSGIYYISSILVFIAIFWVLIPSAATTSGKRIGEKSVKEYLSKGCTVNPDSGWENCIAILSGDDSILYEGLLIAATENKVSLFTKNGSILIRMPQDSKIIHKYVQQEFKNNE